MTIRTLDNIDVQSKRVLVRVDFNVPVDNGVISDATRVLRAKATIDELVKKRAKVILLSHFGRPKGQVNEKFSMRQLVKPLEKLLEHPILFASDCIGTVVANEVANLRDGDILLLENTRFHRGEEANAPEFVRQLAENGDLFVNDAFSAAHRAHASTEGLAHLLPSFAGRALEKELSALERALGTPTRPVIAIVGGAKVSTKIALLENLVRKVDALVIGGGMANTFLAAQGIDVANSLYERDLGDTARAILHKAEQERCAVILPVDATVAPHLALGSPWHHYGVDALPEGGMILDLGPQSIERINAAIGDAATVVWNGPLGAFEVPPFDQATVAIAKKVAELTTVGKVVSVAGGGDTVSALNHASVAHQFSYVSTAGGAFLGWMEGKQLPGVLALEDA